MTINIFKSLFIKKNYDKNLFMRMLTICWQIWKARNDCSFRNIRRQPASVITVVAVTLKNYENHNLPNVGEVSQKPQGAIRWRPPPKQYVKINFDGSVSSSSAACGFILRDHEGKPIVVVSKNAGRASVPMVEALVLLDGLQHAARKRVRKLQVEGGSKLVIDAITKKFSPPWRIQQIIEDIHKIASKFEDITFKHIFREPNFAAEACAHLGLNCNRENSWEPWLPSRIARAVHFDNLEHGCLRGDDF